ncbi:MAG: transcriptional repressor [Pseudomonadota bacterium]
MAQAQILDIEKELAEAEAQSVSLGERFTLPRRKTYRKLLEAGRPLKAYDIIGIVDEDNRPAKPPTIYRALEFLCRLGLVHKIESDSSYFVCSHHRHCDAQSHVPLVMICIKCGKVFEDHVVALENIMSKNATARGFNIQKMMIEAHGICEDCEKIS